MDKLNCSCKNLYPSRQQSHNLIANKVILVAIKVVTLLLLGGIITTAKLTKLFALTKLIPTNFNTRHNFRHNFSFNAGAT